jgi:predicted nucleic acid-binding protein
MARHNSYLLDTNALIALFRNNDLGKYIDQTYHLTSPSTASYVPVVVIGEIHSLALQWGWDATRVTALQTGSAKTRQLTRPRLGRSLALPGMAWSSMLWQTRKGEAPAEPRTLFV